MAFPLPSEPQFDRAEVFQLYRGRGAPPGYEARTRMDLDGAQLDPIPDGLVGCANIGRIGSSAARFMAQDKDTTWMRPALSLRGDLPAAEAVPHRSSVIVSSNNPFTERFIGELTSGDHPLLEFFDESKWSAQERCGMFGVPKKNDALRVIFDARPANERLKPLDESLVIFNLEQLIRTWAAVASRKKSRGLFLVNVDYRHYYYQLTIPEWLKRYVVVEVLKRQYCPAALPMGYRDACAIAQVVTWLTVLHRVDGDPLLGIDEAAFRGPCMPPFLPLKDGGAIFGLLDGVFIITGD